MLVVALPVSCLVELVALSTLSSMAHRALLMTSEEVQAEV